MATPDELHQAALKIGRANPEGRQGVSKYLKRLDYSVRQQCIHCGMCLPTCPTYDETKLERNGPRGRIALMRSIADGRLEVTQAFGQELYFCLGCLACETACPAGVRYSEMFEHARADIEQAGVQRNPVRDLVRAVTLRCRQNPWPSSHESDACATSCQPLSMVSECPRFGISRISVRDEFFA